MENGNAPAGSSPAGHLTRDALLLLLLTATSVLLHGYHYGHQDQAVWLPAIKKVLNPNLYPFDSTFFLAQTQLSLFPQLVAFALRTTRLPADWGVFLWHLVTIYLVLLGCLGIARRCFAKPGAQWAAVATIWATRLMTATGSKVNLMDRYLHPRDLATPMILFALVALLDRKLIALAWIFAAGFIHPTMAIFGAYHLAIQAWKLPRPMALALASALAVAGMLLLPLAWPAIGPVPNSAWSEALAIRRFLFPLRWHWYEWLGVVVPLGLLLWYARTGRRADLMIVAHISGRLALAGALGVVGSVIISTVPALERFIPTEPMRTLHLVYLLWILLSGGLLGEYVLRDRPLRWIMFFAPLCVVFFLGNHLSYRASPQVEWPGQAPRNAWLEAFDWARRNTPRDAIFALDPTYMNQPGEDSHGFRAFAERSALVDGVKDWAVTVNCPELAYAWRQQMRDLAGWRDFRREDFLRLERRYRVTWVVVQRSRTGPPIPPAAAELPCPYANNTVMVCRVE